MDLRVGGVRRKGKGGQASDTHRGGWTTGESCAALHGGKHTPRGGLTVVYIHVGENCAVCSHADAVDGQVDDFSSALVI